MQNNRQLQLLGLFKVFVLLGVVFVSGTMLTSCGPTTGDNQNENTVVNENENTGPVENENENVSINENVNESENENDNVIENENANVGGNQDPVADAGEGQEIARQTDVQLDASGSSDPDGDQLTFSWEQTAGTQVDLTLAQPVKPTFTTPNEDVTLTFEVTVDDGNGATSTDTVDVIVAASLTPQLYAANLDDDSVTGYLNPAELDGNQFPNTKLQGSLTDLDEPSGVVLSSTGWLITVNVNTPSLTVYEDAIDKDANERSSGTVEGAATEMVQPVALAIIPEEDMLFVAEITGDEILVFEGVSDDRFDGTIVPPRLINTQTSRDLNDPFGLSFSPSGELYVANNGGNNVLVFSDAGNLDGDVSPNRIITSDAFLDVYDAVVDKDDNLFVVDSGGQVFIFNNSSALNGSVLPSLTLIVQGAEMLTSMVVDSNGVGYIADYEDDAVYIFDNAATLNGVFTADRTLQGGNSSLNGPIRLFHYE